MPNLANAKKALRQSMKRARRNKLAKAELHSMRVKLRKAVEAKHVDESKDLAKTISKMLDKLEARGIMKKNTVARTKSRMMKKVNALSK